MSASSCWQQLLLPGCPQIEGYALTDWEPSIQIQPEPILHIQSGGHSRSSEGFLIGLWAVLIPSLLSFFDGSFAGWPAGTNESQQLHVCGKLR